MDIRVLFIGLTTVFAWTPATILLILALFGLISAVLNIAIVPAYISLSLFLVGMGSIAGYVSLCSICWGLKLKENTRFCMLLLGVMTLIIVITIGATSQSKLLHIEFVLEDIYLFICPLIFGLIHIFLYLIQIKKQQT
jgi:hypothetical protein